MSNWAVPLSSSPPSTPASSQRHASNNTNGSSTFAINPSTTPAGPPPSSAKSFTPTGPPPSSIFGSSKTTFDHPFFNIKPSKTTDLSSQNKVSFDRVHSNKQPPHPNPRRPIFKSTNAQRTRSTRNRNFGSSPPGVPGNNGNQSPEWEDFDEQGEEDLEDGDYGEESDQEIFDGVSEAGNKPIEPVSLNTSGLDDLLMSGGNPGYTQYEFSTNDGAPRGTKRSLGGATMPHGSPQREKKPRAMREASLIPVLAKNMSSQLGVAKLDDPDNLIMGTEDLVSQLYALKNTDEGPDRAFEIALPDISERLNNLWNEHGDRTPVDGPKTGDYTVGIGPDRTSPIFQSAIFVATLLLQLHHPRPAKGKQAFAISRAIQPSPFSKSLQPAHAPQNSTALPNVLIDWLNNHHCPYRIITLNLFVHKPNPTANVNFWDILFSSALRGQIYDVVKFLKKADFKDACTAREDGQDEDGYRGIQLGNIERVINRAIQLLEICPALQDGDWDVPSFDWQLFRKRVDQALDDLATLAEGRDRDLDLQEPMFEATNFGIKSRVPTLSQSTRRAESRVPWTIYQNLKALYGILLGGTTEIISLAQDWIEATVALAIWWDGNDDDDDFEVGSLAMTRRSLRRTQSRSARLVDLNSKAAYLRRLASAFARVTDRSEDEMFQINPVNPVEVGLASIFEGNTEDVICLLRGWSLPIASAIVEIASLGGWYQSAAGAARLDGFDESDLMVLSYGQQEETNTRDGILMDYAEGLCEKDVLQHTRTKETKEGWEMAIGIISRMGDVRIVQKKVGELLRRIHLDSDKRVDKILDVCRQFGMKQEGRNIAEKYADSIAENTNRYGAAIIYYARAHSAKKLKDVLDLLISLSLVQSFAFPSLFSLDKNLHALIFFPKDSLDELAELDCEAAKLLHLYLTGYATMRRFYDLRDEEVNLKEGQKPTLQPVERKRTAAAALLAVINSAADNIHGGLYDEDRGSVVQVDGLLALLGEAMLFVDQPKRILSLSQCFALLKAIEDLQSVTQGIYARCEECFRSTLAAAYGSQQPPPPQDLLRKAVSSMTSSTGFSLVGSFMLESESSSAGGGGSGVVVNAPKDGGKGDGVKRGWDWRKGVGRKALGSDVLRVLRLGLARDISRAWVEGGDL